ncbi:amino acid permease [Paenibacillus flagellatus]|uniref:Gamma-aminobutyrate permease n=1 Tax=Paenibacillus flagellatus TaxID=2211139 RepID=A0A2V5KGP5_9BACL|nr:amino acid permease [Paenibacillus flagellatus]PYI57573.1 gamma-aminobutyrate permease [Paenibacillus flagellatus]
MISLGGAIGTGVFLASGSIIRDAGPGGALAAYAVIGAMVYFLMTSLGEMATYMPVSGSFSTYAARFVDPALGFAFGWNYWYSWAITIAVEISAGAVAVGYWLPDSPSWLWSGLFLALLFLLNALSVKGYGETEYWFSMIKVATIIIFIVVGLLMIVGIMGGEPVGFSHFTHGDAPFHGGWLAVFGAMMVAGFSFLGSELVGVAAGETDDPRRTVPKAIRQVFWRILLFYVLAIGVIGLLLPYDDPALGGGGDLTDVASSPFTIVFDKAGLALSASIMNAVILSSILSAGNSSMYAATRMLWGLANEGYAPKPLARLDKRGVPLLALLATTVVGCFAFLASRYGEGAVFTWLLNASGLSGFLIWLGIAISHYRFRRAFKAQGKSLDELPYKARWFPFGPLFAFALCSIVILGQNVSAFTAGAVDWEGLLVSYIGLPLFVALWLGYKWAKRTKIVPLEQCDLEQGRSVPDR